MPVHHARWRSQAPSHWPHVCGASQACAGVDAFACWRQACSQQLSVDCEDDPPAGTSELIEMLKEDVIEAHRAKNFLVAIATLDRLILLQGRGG